MQLEGEIATQRQPNSKIYQPKSTVAAIGKGLYPMVSRNSEGPRSRGTRRTEGKGKDELEQRVLVVRESIW